MARYNIRVNGEARSVDADPDTPMLYVLRDNLALKGPKFGCGLAQCGACAIHVNGEAVRSCVLPIEAVKDGAVTTLEGLGTSAKPSKLQQAFIDEQAAQCGYCVNGMIMTSAAFLAKNQNPSETEIRAALADNLCRCGTHQRIVAAVKRATAA
jgi:nicotinate dehydrogenase subunit A